MLGILLNMIQINDKHDCCGCTACSSICGRKAIEMKSDEEGFLYPKLNFSRCIDCHICEQVCPIISRDKQISDSTPKKVLAVRNKNNNTLLTSSSGGAFAVISEYLLSKNSNIYGAEYANDYTVIHKRETSLEGIKKFRGSKYVQSNICGIYNEIRTLLISGQSVLFSGTPCQVEGLKLFLRKPYENLFTVDILCHGVASPKIFSDYIKFVKKHSIGHLKSIFMKDKTFGWGYQETRLYYQDGSTEFNSPLSRLWNKMYYDHICNRPSCHNCRFTNLKRSGDISLGDFWGIENSHKNFHSNLGVSLLMINTIKGNRLWECIKDSFEYIESNTTECMQPVLKYSRPEPSDRDMFWIEYKIKGFNKTIQLRYKITSYRLFKNYLKQIKNIIIHK